MHITITAAVPFDQLTAHVAQVARGGAVLLSPTTERGVYLLANTADTPAESLVLARVRTDDRATLVESNGAASADKIITAHLLAVMAAGMGVTPAS